MYLPRLYHNTTNKEILNFNKDCGDVLYRQDEYMPLNSYIFIQLYVNTISLTTLNFKFL